MSDVIPYRTTLQIPFHCCRCGNELPKNVNAVMAVVPISFPRTRMLTSCTIVWCDPCWMYFNELGGKVEDKTLPHGKKQPRTHDPEQCWCGDDHSP